MLSTKAYTTSADLETSATEKLVATMRQPTPDAEYRWIQRLGSVFSEHSLDNVDYDRIPMINKYRTFIGQFQIMTYEEFCDKLEETNSVDQAQEGRRIIEELRTEFCNGSYIDQDYVCVVGRKRLE
ncbi:MAG: hypothetical protein LQ342_008308 [Letrouitia transgressa]|nr:MAG: hypothetical protein LQ342_008308 [Letrouitia transgressa]